MSRTSVRRVESGRSQVAKVARQVWPVGRRGDVVGIAAANAVESLETRCLLSGGLQGSYFESANNAADYNRDSVLYSTAKGTRVDPIINFIAPGAGTDQDPNGGGAFNGANGTNQRGIA